MKPGLTFADMHSAWETCRHRKNRSMSIGSHKLYAAVTDLWRYYLRMRWTGAYR